MSSGGKANHLISEKSPYLLQHAYNPVDWRPWGEEAFSKARAENKPILLSIGYATCHWCHVMERESFSQEKIAAVLNAHFVAIKVDREERPDVDRIYMTAVQALTGQGGWPLNVFLTPELKPFFGGTYFPPEGRWGRPGFVDLLSKVAELWKADAARVRTSAQELSSALSQFNELAPAQAPAGEAAFKDALLSFKQSFDLERGGFARAPKFPMPVNLNFFLRHYHRYRDADALKMTTKTLDEMAKGGIRDQVGGGFHRYSTDERWHVPHFEKMLYDNAQLAVNYIEAFQTTGDAAYAEVARDTLDYVLRDLTHKDGAFFCAEDADSLPPELEGKVDGTGHEHRREGAFYLWTKSELERLLGQEAALFCSRFGVKDGGNVLEDPHGDFGGKNVLFQARSIEEAAKDAGLTPAEARRRLKAARETLLAARAKRPRPQLDDKVLACWNGLAISAFAKAGAALEEPAFIEAAAAAARFLRERMYDAPSRTLFRRWRENERKIEGLSDDYAFLAQGLLDLYEATLQKEWLDWSGELMERALELFYDDATGAFYGAPSGRGDLLLRLREESDNVEPAAASIGALNLLRLGRILGRDDLQEKARKTLNLFGETMKTSPRAVPQMLVALDWSLSKPSYVAIQGEPAAADFRRLLAAAHARFLPHTTLKLEPSKGKAAAYACVELACKPPTSDPAELARQLQEVA